MKGKRNQMYNMEVKPIMASEMKYVWNFREAKEYAKQKGVLVENLTDEEKIKFIHPAKHSEN